MSKARNMARMGQDTSAGYTGAFDMPAGTTAERPASAGLGWTRLNTETGSVEIYDGTNWNSVTRPLISTIDGNIFAGVATNLVLTGQNFTSTITVRFLEANTTIADVTGVVVTAGSATVAVPSAVFNQTVGDTIEVKMLNSDGTMSVNSFNEIVLTPPSGGTITTSGSYRIHTFTSSSSFVVPSGLTLNNVEYLVIAGGGSGASYTGSAYVGGNPGNNSVFGSITSTAGGGGKAWNVGSPNPDGGSGGGGGANTTAGGSGTAGQGFGGGTGFFGSPLVGGGGGGAGAVGANASSGVNGNGGTGVSSNITGTAVTRGGGGGGGSVAGATIGTGGAGGGGNGAAPGTGSPGSPNTGGGGGSGDAGPGAGHGGGGAGGYRSSVVGQPSGGGGSAESRLTLTSSTYTVTIGAGGTAPAYAGNGGSGIVIVRYAL